MNGAGEQSGFSRIPQQEILLQNVNQKTVHNGSVGKQDTMSPTQTLVSTKCQVGPECVSVPHLPSFFSHLLVFWTSNVVDESNAQDRIGAQHSSSCDESIDSDRTCLCDTTRVMMMVAKYALKRLLTLVESVQRVFLT
jgi:hypothetical protein